MNVCELRLSDNFTKLFTDNCNDRYNCKFLAKKKLTDVLYCLFLCFPNFQKDISSIKKAVLVTWSD